jgi:perosamine synthetase
MGDHAVSIPHNKPTLGVEEKAAASAVLESGWVATGPETLAFEAELCEFFGLDAGHAVAVSSGSAALYLALHALSADQRNVALPTYCCAALRNAVGMIGGTPLYVDCGHNGPNIDPRMVTGKSADMLVMPSMYGLPAPDPSEMTVPVIEDIAQSFGAQSNGHPIGLRGKVGICSFYATKMFTSGGQGGAIISRDKNLIDHIVDYRNFDNRHDTVLRFNFQMTDMQASVGRVQLKRMPEFIARRAEIFERYCAAGIPLLDCDNDSMRPVRYRAVTQVSNPTTLIEHLASHGIWSINPLAEEELLDHSATHANALNLATTTVSLPLYPSLSVSDVDRVIQASLMFFDKEWK